MWADLHFTELVEWNHFFKNYVSLRIVWKKLFLRYAFENRNAVTCFAEDLVVFVGSRDSCEQRALTATGSGLPQTCDRLYAVMYKGT